VHGAGFKVALFEVLTVGGAGVAFVRQYPGGFDGRRFQGRFKGAGFALVGRGGVHSPHIAAFLVDGDVASVAVMGFLALLQPSRVGVGALRFDGHYPRLAAVFVADRLPLAVRLDGDPASGPGRRLH
jgi:hypothetical protein